MKKMSVTEYSDYVGVTRQAVLKRLHPEKKPLNFVVKSEKIGNTWVLYIKN